LGFEARLDGCCLDCQACLACGFWFLGFAAQYGTRRGCDFLVSFL
jgi:hypothetical protein